jgi:hypothetical protein
MSRLPPLVRFLLAHAVAFGVIVVLARIPAVAGQLGGWGWVAIDGILACGLCVLLRLPWWWLPIAVILPFAIVGGPALPWWVWAIGFAGLLLVHGGGIATRAPLYLSNAEAVRHLSELLPRTAGVRACDLGAGLGGPMVGLARMRPDAVVVGVEAGPLPWLVCSLRALARSNARVIYGNIFRHDLADYHLVYAFLSPEPMLRLWDKVCSEMQPGTVFVSNTFAVPGVEAEHCIVLPGRSDARLLVYRVPASSKGSP